MQRMARTINIKGTNTDIPLVGVSGLVTQTSWYEDVPATAAFAEGQETYGWPEVQGG